MSAVRFLYVVVVSRDARIPFRARHNINTNHNGGGTAGRGGRSRQHLGPLGQITTRQAGRKAKGRRGAAVTLLVHILLPSRSSPNTPVTSMCSKLQVHQSLNCKRNPAPRGVHGKGKWSPGGWLAGLGGVHTCPSASGAREVLNPRTVCLKAGTMRRN